MTGKGESELTRGTRNEKGRSKLKRILTIVVFVYLISGLLMCRHYNTQQEPVPKFRGWLFYTDGPYSGQIIDDETGTPVEGAVIFARWVTQMYSAIVFLEHPFFCDAQEAITDKNGKFVLPRIFCFNPYPLTEMIDPRITVFKPGYDSYPPKLPIIDTSNVTAKERESAYIYIHAHLVDFTKQKTNLIKLRKVRNSEERKWVVNRIIPDVDCGVEISRKKLLTKGKNILNVIAEEERNVGIKPTTVERLNK